MLRSLCLCIKSMNAMLLQRPHAWLQCCHSLCVASGCKQDWPQSAQCMQGCCRLPILLGKGFRQPTCTHLQRTAAPDLPWHGPAARSACSGPRHVLQIRCCPVSGLRSHCLEMQRPAERWLGYCGWQSEAAALLCDDLLASCSV